MKILATADIHIGRRSASFESHSSRSAWERIVEKAISEKIDLLLLAGDIVDEENKFFEAVGPLERGVSKLAENRIQTVAVAGNHDFDVLKRIAKKLPSEFKLFSNEWSYIDFPFESPQVRIIGWSFPEAHYKTSPVSEFKKEFLKNDLPTFGLLHADLDNSSSIYAPVKSSELLDIPLDLWILGHIHKPGFCCESGGTTVLYCGSPQALDPSETGIHGSWILELKNGKLSKPSLIPISSVMYDKYSISISGAETEEELQTSIYDGIKTYCDRELSETCLTEIQMNLTIEGETSHPSLVREISEEFMNSEKDYSIKNTFGNEIQLQISDYSLSLRPKISVEKLSKESGVLGVMAKLIQKLERGDESETVEALMKNTDDIIQRFGAEIPIKSNEDTRRLLIRAGREILATAVESMEKSS